MADNQTSQLLPMTCPHCNFKLPTWKALLVTRWTRYTCPSCHTLLEPVLRETELSGLGLGLLGAAGAILLGKLLMPLYGWSGTFIGWGIFLILGLFLSTIVVDKYVHLREVRDYAHQGSGKP